VTFIVKYKQPQSYIEIFPGNIEGALLDYEEASDRKITKYRCSDCGLLFNTLEEYNFHWLRIHIQPDLSLVSNKLE
jgi:hypothetical protein